LEGRRNTNYHTGQLADGSVSDPAHRGAHDNDVVVRDQAGDRIYPDELSARRLYEHNARVLAEIADELLNGGHAGVIGGERPHVEITINLADLCDQTGHGELTLIGATNPNLTTPIANTTVREHTCDAHIRRVILNEPPPDPVHQHQHRERLIRWLLRTPSDIVDYGREERIVPPGLRRVLARRDGGCIYPGCTRPPQHTHAHHVQHWADNGTTDLANLASLCNTHHHAIHEQAITITPTPSKQPNQPGYWTITPQRS